MFRTATIAALVGFVSANSYSIGCMNTLIQIGQNPDVGACLQPSLLLPILVGMGNSGDSIISYVDTWLTSLCGSPLCSDATLNAVVTNVTSACSAEFSLPDLQTSLNFVRTNYATARKVMCLKDGQVNCLSGTLYNIQSVTGAMSLNNTNIISIVKTAKAGFPSKFLCTDCLKGAYSLIKAALPGTFSTSDAKYASDTCGASFVDGGIPPGLVEVQVPAAKSVVSTTTTIPLPVVTITSSVAPVTSFTIRVPSTTITPTPTRTPTPTPTPVKKNAAVGRLLSCHPV